MYTLSPNYIVGYLNSSLPLSLSLSLYIVNNYFYLPEDNEKPILPGDAQHWFLQQVKNILYENT